MEKVKKIKYLKRKQLCQLELYSGNLLFLSMDLVIKYKISRDKTIDDKLILEIKKEQRIFDARRTAMNFVSYKPRTENQVRIKLHSLGYNTFEIANCIQFLKKFEYLDDDKFTEKFIKDSLSRKSPSRKKLIFDLTRKGISKEIICKYINRLFDDKNDYENARRKVEKVKFKFSAMEGLERKKYIYNYLLRQGFSSDTIRIVLSEYL